MLLTAVRVSSIHSRALAIAIRRASGWPGLIGVLCPIIMVSHSRYKSPPLPAHNTPIKPGQREALLIAIAKAREWMEETRTAVKSIFVLCGWPGARQHGD